MKFFYFSYFLIGCFSSFIVCGKHEDDLISDLLTQRNYNKISRPVESDSDFVTVRFKTSLQSIIDVNEKMELLVSRLWFTYMWNDSRLIWEPKDYGGVESIRIPWDKIWTPDVLLYNSASASIDPKFPVNAIVNYDGTIKWMPLGIYTSSCSIDITWFPFDDQNCTLKFGLWTYSGIFVLLEQEGDSMSLENFQVNGEWLLLEAPGRFGNITYECCPHEPYYDITYFINIRRRPLYYGSNLIGPSALISSLSIFTFLLPPDTNAKVNLGITIMLAMSVFQIIVSNSVPSTSMSVPLLGSMLYFSFLHFSFLAIYLSYLMIVSTVSLIITIIVINFHHRKPDMCQVSPFIEKYINNHLAWFLRMSRPGRKPTSPFKKYDSKSLSLDASKYMVPSLPHPKAVNDRFSSYLKKQQKTEFKNLDNHPSYLSDPNFKLLTSLIKFKNEVSAILIETKFITNQIRENDTISDEINDWRFAARVIDRFSLFFFSALFFIGTFSILLSSPNLRSSIFY